MSDEANRTDERDAVELAATAFMDQCRTGTMPAVDDWADQNPDVADSVRDLFPMIAALESLKQEDRKLAARNGTAFPLKLTKLGDFRIVREIGRGGMGIVYEAMQESLDRSVALKVLPKQALLDRDQLRRFQREARIAARLHHTNVVSLYGVGQHDGYHFLVMELIDGAPLDQVIKQMQISCGSNTANDASGATDERVNPIAKRLIRQNDVDFHSAARLIRDAAEALDYAAGQDVVHRDIKPGNLLLDEQACVRISDFGLACALANQDGNVTQSLGGTLNYLPPEAFNLKNGNDASEGRTPDQRGDIYSLGLTLYELLTLRPAWNDQSPVDTIQRLASKTINPVRPRDLNASIPRDLETIVLKSIAHRVEDRYATAGDFADDLNRFLQNRPPLAKRSSSLERSWRWCQRNRLAATLAASVAGLLVLLSTVSLLGLMNARLAEEKLQTALNRETRHRSDAEMTLALATEALDDIYDQFAPSELSAYDERTSTGSLDGSSDLATPSLTPTLTPATAVVLENLLQFYDRMSKQTGDSLRLQQAASRAQTRMGDIFRQLGKRTQAMKQYTSAIANLKQTQQQFPNVKDIGPQIANLNNQLGRLEFAQGDLEAARVYHHEALSVLKETAEDSEDRLRLYEQARSLYFLGRHLQVSAARVAVEQLLHQGERRPRKRPPRQRRDDGRPPCQLDDLADFMDAMLGPPRNGPKPGKKNDRARGYLQQAVDCLGELDADERSTARCLYLLACCYRDLAQPTKSGGPKRSNDARDQNLGEQAIEILDQLVQRFPDNPRYRCELIETLRSDIFGSLGGADRVEKALECLQAAREHADQLVQQHPNIPEYAEARMHTLHKLGHTMTNQARDSAVGKQNSIVSETIPVLRAARRQSQMLTKLAPKVASYRLWSMVVHGSLANNLIELERQAEAAKVLDSAADIFLDVVALDAGDRELRRHLKDIRDVLVSLARRAQTAQVVEKLQNANAAITRQREL